MAKVLVSVAGALPILGFWSGLTLAAQLPPVTVADSSVQSEAEGGVVVIIGVFRSPHRRRAICAGARPSRRNPRPARCPPTICGHDCMQNPVPGRPWPHREPTPSEEYLRLNIWAPRAAARAPIMVWIYGRAFQIGSSATIVFDGAKFAADGVAGAQDQLIIWARTGSA
jgi:para-nitrobenzyl esterase